MAGHQQGRGLLAQKAMVIQINRINTRKPPKFRRFLVERHNMNKNITRYKLLTRGAMAVGIGLVGGALYDSSENDAYHEYARERGAIVQSLKQEFGFTLVCSPFSPFGSVCSEVIEGRGRAEEVGDIYGAYEHELVQRLEGTVLPNEASDRQTRDVACGIAGVVLTVFGLTYGSSKER
jgi:hypothetical protein